MARTLSDMLFGGGGGGFGNFTVAGPAPQSPDDWTARQFGNRAIAPPAVVAPRPAPASMRPPAPGKEDRRSWGDKLGWGDNPVHNFLSDNSNMLMGLGFGLMQNDPGKTYEMVMRGKYADSMDAEEARQLDIATRNAASIRAMGDDYGYIADAIENGSISPGDGFNSALKLQLEQQQQAQALQQAQAYAVFIKDPELRSMVEAGALPFQEAFSIEREGMAGSTDSPPVVEIFDSATGMPQKGYMQGTQFVPLGGTKAAPGTTGDLSATETRELFQTEENILAATNVISALDTALDLNTQSASGWGAEQLAGIGANLPDWVPMLGGNEERDANTLQLKNIVTEQALSQLKLVFGAAPTEGERQILLEIQGSVNQPQEVRQRIFDRAKELAVERLRFNEDRKLRIEQGGYGSVQPAAQPAQAMPAGASGQQYATNPATGERLMLQNGQWVPAQ